VLLRFLLLARKHEVCVGSTNETKNSRSGSFLVPRAERRHENRSECGGFRLWDGSSHALPVFFAEYKDFPGLRKRIDALLEELALSDILFIPT
jgi:hypothetical protein